MKRGPRQLMSGLGTRELSCSYGMGKIWVVKDFQNEDSILDAMERESLN